MGDANCGAVTLPAHGQIAESGIAMSGIVTPTVLTWALLTL